MLTLKSLYIYVVKFASQLELTTNQFGEILQSASTRLEGTDLKSSHSSMPDGIINPEFNSRLKKSETDSESNSLSASALEVIKSSNVPKKQSTNVGIMLLLDLTALKSDVQVQQIQRIGQYTSAFQAH